VRHNLANWNAPPNASQSSRIWNFERLEKRDLFAADFLGFCVDSETSSVEDNNAANPLEYCRVSSQGKESINESATQDITAEERSQEESTHRFNTDEIFSSWPFDCELADVG